MRRSPGQDILDYQQVVLMLGDYMKPRDRISLLLEKGDLVRVRKGLYVLGEQYRRGPVVREQLANLIYGPSYVSLDYALSFHGLIPERVDEVTSVTTGKSRRFETGFGVFTYRPLLTGRYQPGITFGGAEPGRFLIASPEKALVDKVWCDKRFKPARLTDFTDYLVEDLRLDPARVASLDQTLLERIASAYASKRITMLVRSIHRFSRSSA
ncbi:MAG TPA: hypothetical protein PKE55_03535 [Kiritimatiellia bacterium]|nr:hypothetical protein [Kiritimatiellia bacterium]